MDETVHPPTHQGSRRYWAPFSGLWAVIVVTSRSPTAAINDADSLLRPRLFPLLTLIDALLSAFLS